MSNYIEYKDKIAFHPGYYIKELVENSELTQEDFAKRLDTTPKNLSLLIRGEQSLSIDIAMKLARLVGTTIDYWLNLQNAYNTLIAEFKSDEELMKEREIFDNLDYSYFRDNFNLPNLPRKKDDQIFCVRNFLNVATLTSLAKRDMAVNFRKSNTNLTVASTIKANAMVQIAANIALKANAPKFNKKTFECAVEYALSLTKNHRDFYSLIKERFYDAGVVLVILPNIPGSKTNGATKKIGDNILLMVNDRRLYSDVFWFTLFHEIGHIMNGDYGISFESEEGEIEDIANKYAADTLIPPVQYCAFLRAGIFNAMTIRKFAESINRDPGIVLGRLQNDKKVQYDDWSLNSLKHKYKVKFS